MSSLQSISTDSLSSKSPIPPQNNLLSTDIVKRSNEKFDLERTNTKLIDAIRGGNINAIQELLNNGASLISNKKFGPTPLDYTTDPKIKTFLQDQLEIQNKRSNIFAQLEEQLQLPGDNVKRLLAIALLNRNYMEQKSKLALRMVLNEKHQLLQKCKVLEAEKQLLSENCRVFEKNLGINDPKIGLSYLDHMVFWSEQVDAQKLVIDQQNLIIDTLKTKLQKSQDLINADFDLSRRMTIVDDSRSTHEDLPSKDNRRYISSLSSPMLFQKTDSQAEGRFSFHSVKDGGKGDSSKEDKFAAENDEIVFTSGENGQVAIKSATVQKLVERLLDPAIHDASFMQAFILNHKAICESPKLLEMIAENFKASQNTNNTHILKAINVLKYWIEQVWSDFQADDMMVAKLVAHIHSIENAKLSQTIRSVLSRKMAGTEVIAIEMPTDCPKPILPKSLQKKEALGKEKLVYTGMLENDDGHVLRLKLTDLDPLEVARQLTLLEFGLFSKIKPREFTDLAWMKEDKEVRAPNIIKMVRWSNHVVKWLVTEIVTIRDSLKSRVSIIEKIIMIAKHCDSLNNFNAVKEIMAALQSSSVGRLKKTNEAISTKHVKLMEEMMTLTANEMNYKNLRAKIHTVEPPLIPFPGVYQGDLVFLESYGRDIQDGMVNFLKLQKLTNYITELEVYQQAQFKLQPVSEIQDMIQNYPGLEESQAYALSLICEPRNAV